jgi:hypothetical protein
VIKGHASSQAKPNEPQAHLGLTLAMQLLSCQTFGSKVGDTFAMTRSAESLLIRRLLPMEDSVLQAFATCTKERNIWLLLGM